MGQLKQMLREQILAEMTYDRQMSDEETVSGNAFSEGWTGLSFILQPNSDWNVDHSFANIRIEKKIR